MKKIKNILLLISIVSYILTGSTTIAAGDFFSNLKPKATAQDRLLPVKQTYDDALTSSEQAAILYNENNIKGSFDVLMKIEDEKRSAQDMLLLGNILQDQGKIADAEFMYKRATTIDAKFYKAYYNLANIYLEQDKPFMAIEAYRKANKLNPKFAYAYYNLGCAYLRTGNLKKAKIAFLKAIELKNTEPNFHYNLAYTYKQLNNEKLAKQYLEFYNRILQSRGENNEQ